MKTISIIATTCFALFALATATQGDAPAPENLIFVPAFKLTEKPVTAYPPKDPGDNVFPNVPFLPTCEGEGYFRDPFNCRKFYQCGGPDAVPYALYCQAGLIFNMKTNWCDHPDRVEC